jgi:hypothetical protein
MKAKSTKRKDGKGSVSTSQKETGSASYPANTKAKSEKLSIAQVHWETGRLCGYEQGNKKAFVLMQKALGNCYCGKYAKCPVVEKIKELSKE